MSHPSLPKTRFVVLAAPRSGSNMLCAMLGSHPSILCHHEIFNPKGIRLALPLRDTDFTLGTVTERERDPLEFLSRIWLNDLGKPCVGFKLTHRQNEPVYRQLLSDNSIAKLILRRQNRLKIYVSRRISESLGEWEVYRHEDLARDRPRINVDVAQLFDDAAFDDAYYAEIHNAIAKSNHRSMELAYEDLQAAGVQNQIQQFLGVEPLPHGLQIRSVKQNSDYLPDLIINYDEVKQSLKGTEFEAELET